MGNAIDCGNAAKNALDPDYGTVVLEGHIKNSQTRALQAILQASGIPFKFVVVENPAATTALPTVQDEKNAYKSG